MSVPSSLRGQQSSHAAERERREVGRRRQVLKALARLV